MKIHPLLVICSLSVIFALATVTVLKLFDFGNAAVIAGGVAGGVSGALSSMLVKKKERA